ncbi:NUDIX domain protein [Variibacter gotjawalensis]|uniref:NUDIX domain protein n=1 Tax=Variibacter gotjawalensis TaxID=1333996 RepID=A0A0S3PU77_9BRAD|nr:NUDIX hydrolase [Variibacter gotjawalensis]RZS45823.1 NUDIX domain-containing protein [Variibacter gotjawalensis]BAT59498.1 NUDIX domain protein [Variibacter gotjawalensis]
MGKRFAALPYRKSKNGEAEILIITSRDTGRWIIPKGRAEKNTSAHRVAAKEAREEAGVLGRITKRPVGKFRDAGGNDRVTVYALKVRKKLKRWLEKGQRDAMWLPARKAARKVKVKGLRALVRGFSKK